MEIRITIEELKKKGLTLTQYITLWGLYNHVKIRYFIVDEEGQQLLLKDFWMAPHPERSGEYALTTKGMELFEPLEGLFEQFVEIFPTRVHNINGEVRVLSPTDPNSMVGKKLRHKWYSVLKSSISLQERVIECLKQEVTLRKKEGSLYYMRAAEAWLNKATWEDYQYLLDKPINTNREFTKVNEIRL